MINRVTLVGNLGRDPELRRLASGAAVARFSLATSERYRDRSGTWREQTEWHDVSLWRGLAERAETQLRRGMLVYVEGKLSTRRYTDRAGVDRKATEVIGSHLRILGRHADVPEAATAPPPPAAGAITLTPPPLPAAPDAVPPPPHNSEDGSGLPF